MICAVLSVDSNVARQIMVCEAISLLVVVEDILEDDDKELCRE